MPHAHGVSGMPASAFVTAPAAQAGGDQHQRYLLFCALLKHAGTAELPPAVRLAVLEQAEAEGSGLEPPLAFPALVAALKVRSESVFVVCLEAVWHLVCTFGGAVPDLAMGAAVLQLTGMGGVWAACHHALARPWMASLAVICMNSKHLSSIARQDMLYSR